MNYMNIIEKSEIDKLKVQLEKRDQTITTLNSIIQSQKEQIEQYQNDRQNQEQKIQFISQQKFKENLNYENIIRKLKQDLEQKSIQFEQMNTRFTQGDQGLLLVKLRSELEEPHKIELQMKEEIISDLKRQIEELKHKTQIQNERINMIQIANQNELAQLKEKYESNVGVDKLQQKQLKELNLLLIKDQEQIKDLLKEKQQQQEVCNQKEITIKELRQQLLNIQKSKQQCIETLTQEIEIERVNKRKLQQDNDDLESALQHIRLTMKSNLQNIVKSDGTSIKDQEFIDLQNRLSDYMRMFEEEKDQKKKLSVKLNEIITLTKQEKADNDKIYENRIKDLQDQLKEEKGMKTKQSIKIKDLYADIEEMKHELNLLKDNQGRIEERAKDLEARERKIGEKEMKINDIQAQMNLNKPPDELHYDIKKLKSKYKTAKQKLIEANQKIVALLSKIKEQDSSKQNLNKSSNQNNLSNTLQQQRKLAERNINQTKNYEGIYNLPDDVDYLGNPYQTEFQMDRISQRLREDILKQKNCLEGIDYKCNIIK